MKKVRLKKMSVMLIGVMAMMTSCVQGDLYDFYEDDDESWFCIEEYKWRDIVISPEFEDYMTAGTILESILSNSNEKIDYSYKKEDAIKLLKESYTILIKSYPSYLSTSKIEKMEMNKVYQYWKNSNFPFKKTKGGKDNSYRTKAWKSLNDPAPSGITKVSDDYYNMESIYIFTFDDPLGAVINAFMVSVGDGANPDDNKETGGYIFDDSSILIIDTSASVGSMNFVYWPFYNNAPQCAFHVHPHTGPLPSYLDAADRAMKNSLSLAGCNGFRIYNLNAEYADY